MAIHSFIHSFICCILFLPPFCDRSLGDRAVLSHRWWLVVSVMLSGLKPGSLILKGKSQS